MRSHKNTTEHQPKLQRAIKKYGWTNIKREILEYRDTKKEIGLLEKEYIVKYDSFHNGYNCTTGGEYCEMSEESKQKHRDYNKNPEVKERKSTEMKERWESLNYRTLMLGAIEKSNEDRKEKKSAQMKERMIDPIFKQGAVEASHTPEANANRSKSLNTLEYRQLRSELAKKQFAEGKSGIDQVKKPIICIETNEIFPSITDAANHFNGQRTHLRAHLKGDKCRPRFKGLHFKYARLGN